MWRPNARPGTRPPGGVNVAMLHGYDGEGRRSKDLPDPIDPKYVWLDLLDPTPAERARVDKLLGAELPTREEMGEIETSSRLYSEDGVLVMTASVLSSSDAAPRSNAVTFALGRNRLVTLRHSEPKPFSTYCTHLVRHHTQGLTAERAFTGLLDAIVDRLADLLEFVLADVDRVSSEVFSRGRNLSRQQRDYGDILSRIGRNGDLVAKARESLLSLSRLVMFASLKLSGGKGHKTTAAVLKTVSRDIASLTDHATYVSNNINFVLDATLGFIGIEQSAIIKIFSLVAFIFLPPTLVASIYGMNFEVMPELSWPWGYPMALVLMLLSAVLPWLFFKRRGWL